MLKAKDFRDQSLQELDQQLLQLKKELFDLRNLKKQTKKLDNPYAVKFKRREIARLMTVRHEKMA